MSADFQRLFDVGVLGVVVVWFMTRMEKIVAQIRGLKCDDAPEDRL